MDKITFYADQDNFLFDLVEFFCGENKFYVANITFHLVKMAILYS